MVLQTLWNRLIGGVPLSVTNGDGKTDPVDDGVEAGQYLQPGQRVMAHLTADDGCEWQSEFVSELEWSASKTSRVLSEMEDAGLVTRYRIGRRKVVCLPGEQPEGLRRADRERSIRSTGR